MGDLAAFHAGRAAQTPRRAPRALPRARRPRRRAAGAGRRSAGARPHRVHRPSLGHARRPRPVRLAREELNGRPSRRTTMMPTVRLGSLGESVKTLQAALNLWPGSHQSRLVVDGFFGLSTNARSASTSPPTSWRPTASSGRSRGSRCSRWSSTSATRSRRRPRTRRAPAASSRHPRSGAAAASATRSTGGRRERGPPPRRHDGRRRVARPAARERAAQARRQRCRRLRRRGRRRHPDAAAPTAASDAGVPRRRPSPAATRASTSLRMRRAASPIAEEIADLHRDARLVLADLLDARHERRPVLRLGVEALLEHAAALAGDLEVEPAQRALHRLDVVGRVPPGNVFET